MNPSSLRKDIWLRRAKGSAVQRQKDMNRIALAMSSVKPINMPVANSSMMKGSPSSIDFFLFCEATSEADEGGHLPVVRTIFKLFYIS